METQLTIFTKSMSPLKTQHEHKKRRQNVKKAKNKKNEKITLKSKKY
jgi:hypothetical protein